MMINTKIFVTIILSIIIFACGKKEKSTETNQELIVKEDTTALEVAGETEGLSEEDMIINAHMNSQLQITLGKVSSEKASSARVKEFGKLMAQENEEIQNHIDELAKEAGLQIDPALTPDYVATIDSIQSYSGEKFDSAFINIVIRNHEEDINNYTKLSNKTNNPIVRELVASTLKILNRHQQQAEKIQKEVIK